MLLGAGVNDATSTTLIKDFLEKHCEDDIEEEVLDYVCKIAYVAKADDLVETLDEIVSSFFPLFAAKPEAQRSEGLFDLVEKVGTE
jgi:hypothetical protein